MPPEKEAAGEVLLCRTYPLGTVDVALAYPRSRILDGGVGRRAGIVVEVSRVAGDTVALRLQLDPDETTGAGVEFEPGQFMELQLPGDERRRAYSMTNTGNWDGEVEFLTRLHEGAYFSGFLSELLFFEIFVYLTVEQGAFPDVAVHEKRCCGRHGCFDGTSSTPPHLLQFFPDLPTVLTRSVDPAKMPAWTSLPHT